MSEALLLLTVGLDSFPRLGMHLSIRSFTSMMA